MTALERFLHQAAELAGLPLSAPVVYEKESADYGACHFGLAGQRIIFRQARITPVKTGQFVTLWKRPNPNAAIQPLAASDAFDFVMIHTGNGMHQGQFIFSKTLLCEQGILSTPKQAGKRALRRYPPWSHPEAKAARQTQPWQLPCFLDLAKQEAADPVPLRTCLGLPIPHGDHEPPQQTSVECL